MLTIVALIVWIIFIHFIMVEYFIGIELKDVSAFHKCLTNSTVVNPHFDYPNLTVSIEIIHHGYCDSS